MGMASITKVRAAYFTGTGNTKKAVLAVAEAAAQALGCPWEPFDFSLPAARKAALSLAPDELLILGTPVYAGRVPNVMLPYLSGQIAGNGAAAVCVVTFGNRNFDDGLIELRELATAAGLRVIAGGAFAGEHSFSIVLGAGRPDASDLALAAQLGRAAAEKLSGEEAPVAPVALEGQLPLRPYYTPRDRNGTPINILKVKPKTDPDKCVKCGLCARICTMGSIDPADTSLISGICIKCCACVKRCPKGAKYFDDAGYLYHQHELEEIYARPAESRIFL